MILSQHVLSFRNQEGEEKNHDASLCDAGNGKIKGCFLMCKYTYVVDDNILLSKKFFSLYNENFSMESTPHPNSPQTLFSPPLLNHLQVRIVLSILIQPKSNNITCYKTNICDIHIFIPIFLLMNGTLHDAPTFLQINSLCYVALDRTYEKIEHVDHDSQSRDSFPTEKGVIESMKERLRDRKMQRVQRQTKHEQVFGCWKLERAKCKVRNKHIRLHDAKTREYYIKHIDGSPVKSDAKRQRVIQCLAATIKRRVSELRFEARTLHHRQTLTSI
ncbi:hypothetical protein JHK87_052556 [Glycine soja]|nr:hypothetical protein JHK87_052556 [Glycine soja]